jgi:hypothetical protein
LFFLQDALRHCQKINSTFLDCFALLRSSQLLAGTGRRAFVFLAAATPLVLASEAKQSRNILWQFGLLDGLFSDNALVAAVTAGCSSPLSCGEGFASLDMFSEIRS